MGTRASCIRCGAKKWINTTYLTNISKMLGVRPSSWLKAKYVCKSCKKRERLIKESTINSVADKLNDFSQSCRAIFAGSQCGKVGFREKMTKFLTRNGIQGYVPVTYKGMLVGIKINLPILGDYGVFFY